MIIHVSIFSYLFLEVLKLNLDYCVGVSNSCKSLYFLNLISLILCLVLLALQIYLLLFCEAAANSEKVSQ